MTAADPVPPRRLRVSHAEREHVIGLLQKAIGLGLIDLDEFSERTDQALASRTREELNVLLIDLPGLVVTPLPARRPLHLKVSRSSLVRNGPWAVPSAICIDALAGDVRLDFSEAEFASRTVEIEFDVKGSNVEITVSRTTLVESIDLDNRFGFFRDQTRSPSAEPERRLRLDGTAKASSIRVRNSRR
ncbi:MULTISPECIES: DUF1707 domain-containing protein [Actinoalloteichus]|uniref:DUF1707 SHOCT-like domain-containing protein n=1 Tax=Actinoalloteichus TaxID=65496 RepID=UPI0018DD3B61|nr:MULTISPECIES: DUF1707 domain-containing protein [Actinoalloteichus]